MTLGLIIAGGRSQRFGAEKAVATLGGISLLERSRRLLMDSCREVAVNAPLGSAAAALAEALGAPVVPDAEDGPRGPLSGVLAGLIWAYGQGEELLLTAPCDAPLLPRDLGPRLLAALGPEAAAVARSPDGVQPLCAVWRTSMIEAIEWALAEGEHPPVRQVLASACAVEAAFDDAGAFLNINTAQDLIEAARRMEAEPPAARA